MLKPTRSTLLDDAHARNPRVLRALLWYLLALNTAAAVIGLPFVFAERVGSAMAIALLYVLLLGTRWAMLRGFVRVATFALVLVLWLVFAILSAMTGGIYSANLVMLVAMAAVAGLLLGPRVAITVVGATVAWSLVLAWLEVIGHPPPRVFPAPPFSRWAILLFASGIILIPLAMALRILDATVEHLRQELQVRREAERALRESEERYRTILETMNDGVLVLAEATGKVVEANPRVGQLFGASCAEMMGRTLRAVSTQIENGNLADLDERLRREVEQKSQLFEWELQLLDGSRTWVELSVQRAVHRGERSLFVTVRPIDERRQAENERNRLHEQLRQAQKMEAVGRLAGGVAHDFNNLLTGILGNAELLLLDLEPGSQLRSEVEEIRHAGRRAAELTSQLLAFSRKQALERRSLDLSGSVTSVRKLLSRLLGEQIEVVTHVESNLDRVLADPVQMDQVLLNLAVNARDAMPNGGTLTFHASNHRIGSDGDPRFDDAPPGDYVLLTVGDTGAGIPEDVLKNLFEPFFTTKPRGKGTGLGLAMVHGVVRQHGGYIGVTTRLGQGTQFHILLPRSDARDCETESVETKVESIIGTETIIVSEDDDVVRHMISDSLQRFGYRVVAFDSAEAALAAEPSVLETASLLLTDIVLSGATGRVLAKELTARYPRLRVLFCSGYDEERMALNGAPEHGGELLRKPFSPQELAERIREILDRG